MTLVTNQTSVAVLMASFNEEKTIAKSVESLMRQTHKPKQIVCVDDMSSDNTYKVLRKLARKIKILEVYQCKKKRFRAGALNMGLTKIHKPVEYVLTMDADTELKNNLIEKGLIYFQKYKNIGGACSIAGLKKAQGLLYRLQKLEYGAGFDAERTATFENVMVLHGMCTIFRKSVLLKVGGFTEGHLIEDYDITLKLKENGFRAMYNPEMEAYTLPPANLFDLVKQRLRWSRGGIDIIIEHGISRNTIGDLLDHILFILLMLVMIMVIFTSLFSLVLWHYAPHPLAIALGLTTYFIHIYRMKFVKNLEWADYILRLVIIPELLLSMLLSGVQVWAYVLALTNRKRNW